MRPPRGVANGTAVTINGVLPPPPPPGLSPGEGRAAGEEEERWRRAEGARVPRPPFRLLRLSACSAIAPRTPRASGNPAPSGAASPCRADGGDVTDPNVLGAHDL